MHDTGTWVICAVLAWLIVAAFAGKKAQWYPFGGLIKHDKRTGATSLIFTLPHRRRKGRRR